MNNLRKRKICAAFIAAALVLGIALTSCAKAPPRVYIALGDSVAAGFGVEPESRYVNLLFDKLSSEGLADEYYNFAVSGFDTSMLIDLLKGVEDLEPFANASVITLNIGGNNVLMPFREYLPDIDELIKGIAELAVFIAEARETLSEASALISDAQELVDDFSIFDIPDAVSLIRKILPVLEDLTGVVRGSTELDVLKLIPLLTGSFTDELDAALEEGIDTFDREFTEIISWLGTNAPDAVIVVNTVYNPVPGDLSGLLTGLHSRAEELTDAINDVILREGKKGGYLVSDVAGAFGAERNVTDVLNFNLNVEEMTLNFDIIHPNSRGHKMIAELNGKTLEAYMLTKG